MFAASVAIMIMVVQREKGIALFLFIVFFIGQVNFSIWVFVFALRAYSVKTSYYPDIKKYAAKNWTIEKSFFIGGINQGFIRIIDDLDAILKKLVANVQCCRIFLTISLVFGILLIVSFILHLLNHYIRI
jgi:hypothetical protein